MTADSRKLVKKHPALTLSEDLKVSSHVQREKAEWIENTLMIEGYDVPFKYKRKRRYKSLKGARVNLSYYPQTQHIGSLEFEYMKVISVKRS